MLGRMAFSFMLGKIRLIMSLPRVLEKKSNRLIGRKEEAVSNGLFDLRTLAIIWPFCNFGSDKVKPKKFISGIFIFG